VIQSSAFLRRAGLAEGDRVSVALRPVDSGTMRVPAPLAEALAAAPDLAAVWEGPTPGARGGFSPLVAGAKRAETVAMRVSRSAGRSRERRPRPTGRPPPCPLRPRALSGPVPSPAPCPARPPARRGRA